MKYKFCSFRINVTKYNVAFATKEGFYWKLDRATGDPLQAYNCYTRGEGVGEVPHVLEVLWLEKRQGSLTFRHFIMVVQSPLLFRAVGRNGEVTFPRGSTIRSPPIVPTSLLVSDNAQS